MPNGLDLTIEPLESLDAASWSDVLIGFAAGAAAGVAIGVIVAT